MVNVVPTTNYWNLGDMDTIITIRCANETCAHSAEHHTHLGPFGMADFLQTLRNLGWSIVDDEIAYCPRCRKDLP